VLPEDFAKEWAEADSFEEAGERLAPKTGGTLIITLGTRGSVAFTKEGLHHQAAFLMDPVVDTTGAGDVYHGAFALAIGQGKSLEEAMRFASAAAALSCRALGGRAGLATADEVEALMARG
jgi:sugar/nucleoside kinase (ribokinase family)